MACMILQRQIDCIGGKKENIIVPNIAIKKLREREQAGLCDKNKLISQFAPNVPIEIVSRELAVNTSSETNSSTTTDVDMTASSTGSSSDENMDSSTANIQVEKDKNAQKAKEADKTQGNNTSPANPCVLCLEDERRLACIPCGHLATCVPCGHSLRSCPICRTTIDAFVRIYI